MYPVTGAATALASALLKTQIYTQLTFRRRDPQPLLQNPRKVRRPRPMPQQQPLPNPHAPEPPLLPRPRLALTLHPKRIDHLHPIMPMRRPVRVARVRLERPPLPARARNGLHAAQAERAEVRVERVDGVAEGVFGEGGGEELRRDLHVAQGVDELELAL